MLVIARRAYCVGVQKSMCVSVSVCLSVCLCVCLCVCPRSVLDTALNVSELVNAVSGVKKQSKSGYFWDSDRFWIQILNVSELENAVSGVQKESKSGNRVPFGPPLPCGCNLVLETVKIERCFQFKTPPTIGFW